MNTLKEMFQQLDSEAQKISPTLNEDKTKCLKVSSRGNARTNVSNENKTAIGIIHRIMNDNSYIAEIF